MALSEYQPVRFNVKFKGGSFDVRGLSLDDITEVIGTHLQDMDHIIALYKSEIDPRMQMIEGASFVLNIVKDAPALTAKLIAIASDEPTQIENARRLPIPVQIEAAKQIMRLTFEEHGGIKKFLASLQAGMEMIAPANDGTTGSDTSHLSDESTAS